MEYVVCRMIPKDEKKLCLFPNGKFRFIQPPSQRIFFALSVSANPPHSTSAMRPVCFLDSPKNLRQSEELHRTVISLEKERRERRSSP